MTRLVFIFLLISTAILQSATAGPIYTWQDENGQVFYSDRPLAGEDRSEQVNLETEVSSRQNDAASDRYSIRDQIEYFDEKKEQRRKAWLEERRLRQESRAQDLEEQRLQYELERSKGSDSDRVYMGYYPGYRPIYNRPHRPHRPSRPRGIEINSPYMQQYEYVPELHRFNQQIGNPYPSYPLNFWKH